MNPGRRRLKGGEVAIVIGTSQQAIDNALAQDFSAAPPFEGTAKSPVLESADALPGYIKLEEVPSVFDPSDMLPSDPCFAATSLAASIGQSCSHNLRFWSQLPK